MAKGPLPRLHDILRSIGWIEQDMKGVPLERFLADRRLRQLVERNIEIVSEASRAVPPELKARHGDIPWREIAGIGNVLRHDYEAIAPKLLWDTVRRDIPPLKGAVRALIATLERQARPRRS